MSDNATESPDTASRGEPDHYVLGGGTLGVAIARRLREQGHATAIVDDSVSVPGLPVVEADPADMAALREAGLSEATTVVVATRSDRQNLLVAQLVRTRFDGPRVIVLANADERVGLFTDAGHETVCTTTVISKAVAERV